MADWDTGSPSNTAIVSSFPANERAARTAVKTNFGVEHRDVDDANVGYHKRVTVLDDASDPTFPTGTIGLWNNAGSLRTRVAAGTVHRVISFAAGTKLLFPQAAVPTGWTLDTDVHDRVIRVNNTSGGGLAGNWTISGLTHAHTHTTDITSHKHDTAAGVGPALNPAIASGGAFVSASGVKSGQQAAFLSSDNNITTFLSGFATGITNFTSSGASSSAVVSDGAWRPLYLDVVKGSLS